MLKAFTGEIRALIAIGHLTAHQPLALLLDEGALFVTGSAAGAVGHFHPLALDVVLQGQVAAADGAVHAAGGNQFLIHRINVDEDFTTS